MLLDLHECVIDVETTTYNKGHPFDPRNKLVSYATLCNNNLCFKYFNDPDFGFGSIAPNSILIGFNIKFDCHWLFPNGIPDNVKIWDCQLAEFVYSGQRSPLISLNECLEKYDLETKKDLVKEYWDAGVQTDEIPLDILEEYNKWDVIQTKKLYDIQQTLLDDKQKALVYLLGEDLKVLASIERSGLLFDKTGALQKLESLKDEIWALEIELGNYLPPIKHGRFNFDSGDHLSCFLYGGTIVFAYAEEQEAVYKSGAKKGRPYVKRTWLEETVHFPQLVQPLEGSQILKSTPERPLYKTDAPTLSSLKTNKRQAHIISLIQKRSELQKLVEMLESLFEQFEKKQWTDNLVHSNYNQNIVITGRLSSSSPNLQNTPPEVDKFFVSRYD